MGLRTSPHCGVLIGWHYHELFILPLQTGSQALRESRNAPEGASRFALKDMHLRAECGVGEDELRNGQARTIRS